MAGTARSSMLGAFEWSPESGFANNAADTTTTRMIVRDESIDVSNLARPLLDRGGVFQYLDDGEPNVLGAFGTDGTFSVTFDLAGHGTTTAGALTQTNLSKLLAHVFGGSDVTNVGGTESEVGNSVTVLKPNGGSELFTPGGLLRAGSLGDDVADGQCAAIASTSGTPNTTVTLLTALADVPTSGHNYYAMQQIWPRVDPAGTIITSTEAAFNSSLRVRLATSNLQFICRGVAATGATISGLSPGEVPQIAITFHAAAWAPIAGAFPSTQATTEHYAAPNAGGSLFVQDRATTTHNLEIARSFEFSVGFGVVPIMGNTAAASNAGQTIVGYRRVPARSSFSFVVEAEAATTTPTYWDWFSTDANTIALKHVLLTCNPHDGRALGFYFPRCRPTGAVPTQSAVDGLNYVTVSMEPLSIDDTTVSSTIENAPWVMAMG